MLIMSRMSLVPSLYYSAALPAESLETARRTVDGIYGAAGVRIAWVVDPGGQVGREIPGLHVCVLLLTREMGEQLGTKPITDGVLGVAVGAARRAYVLTDRIAEQLNSADFINDFGATRRAVGDEVLGNVIAHEIGHVLLGPAHSERGIMRADLVFPTVKRLFVDLNPPAQLRFTNQEIVALQQVLRKRATNNPRTLALDK